MVRWAKNKREWRESMEKQQPYFHTVQYYETDAMAVVHHANYIRWFEEARLDYLKQAGFPYEAIEERGLMVPVLGASCEYRIAVRFGETVRIETEIVKFNGLKFTVAYEIYDQERKRLHARGMTEHCFLNRDFKPVSIKRKAPDLYEFFISQQSE